MAAVRELQPEYEGRVLFTIVPQEETAELAHEIEGFELGSHGLVAFSPEGETVATLPGHSYGKEEIVVVIGQVLEE